MQIYLLQDIPKIGKNGEIREVSQGFGRYLLKQKQAGFVTPEFLKKIEQQKVKEKQVSESELKKMQEIAGRLDGGEVEIEAGGKEGTFYSALSAKEIAKAIKEQFSITVRPEQIKVKRPIKEAGEHDVLVGFGHGLEAEVKVIVS